MFPWNYGFHWSPGTMIFLGAFYTVVLVILTTLANVLLRSWRDVRLQKADAIRWHEEFSELPVRDRSCRHELSGEVKERKCPNAFDCRHCEMHPKFVAARTGTVRQEPLAQMICGMPFPSDRLYHRGHTWARAEKDGTVTVGLDELGKRMLGVPDKMELPELGVRVHTNGTAWRAEKRGAEIRLLSPVDGEVIETGGPDAGWYLKVKPQGAADMRHLLEPSEVEAWMMRELERLQIALGVGGSSVSLADGGVPVDDIGSAYPGADWDTVSGEMFLNS